MDETQEKTISRIHALRLASELDEMALTLQGWATQSLTGSWSTHQVDANRAMADKCVRLAWEIRKQTATQ